MDILKEYKQKYAKKIIETLSLEDYLQRAQHDATMYNSPAERLLKAIGEPKLVDTAKDARLSRIFGNRVIRRYDVFKDFYGMEDVLEQIVSYFRHSSQGLEESRQILYLLGPVGSAKSSIAERLKELMEQEVFYALKDSPIYESPLGLFSPNDEKKLKIPKRYLNICPSPWAIKKMEEYGGDLSKFQVIKLFPNQDHQIAIAKTEPGDENNQDISSLVGKIDIRKLEFYSQNDPEAYNFSGGLCLAHRGILDFVEMFKAPIKVLHPLLTATQEGNYKGTEAISSIPFDGIVLAHSNESEWNTFKSNKNNEAFLDRIYVVEVPYCLRVQEEEKIYKKLLNNSELASAPCAPGTLEMLAEFSVLTRLEVPDNSTVMSKMKVYNGENVKDKDPTAKSLQEYVDMASKDEGFRGVSTRLAYKILAKVYNFDTEEIGANPVHMLYVLEKTILNERLSQDEEMRYLTYIKKHLAVEYCETIGKEIQTAYLDSSSEYGQSLFDRYILFSDHWLQDNDYRDPDTGQMFDREMLNEELEKLEKPAGIANPKDFRNEVVHFSLRYQARHEGCNPDWTAYEKLREVIEASLFSKTEDLLPVISFSGSADSENMEKHLNFVDRMMQKGYTQRQARLVTEWHLRYKKSK